MFGDEKFFYAPLEVFMNIYVGNLPYNTNDADMKALFENYGTVTSTSIISDKFTGRSRGFGFVEMSDDDQARQAIEATNGADYNGRALVVNEARPREERPRREFSGGGNRGGGGYGGGERRGGSGGGRDRY
jgi:RNA recognition motif-containing protein